MDERGIRVLPPPAPATAGPHRTRRPRGTGAIVLALFLLTAGLGTTTAVLWNEVGGLEHRLDTLAALEERLETSEADAGALRERIGTLEAGAFDPAGVVSAVAPSVFTILAPTDEGETSLGTGFVLESDGHRSILVTNFHVVEERWRSGHRDLVVERGQRVYEGAIVRVAIDDDLAVIEVVADLAVLPTASEPPAHGAPVVVVGSGWGFEGTVTTGVVSAIDRPFAGKRWLQVSAQISPGNSGGPVVDAQGRVVGVATWKIAEVSAEALGFAIPISRVCAVLDLC